MTIRRLYVGFGTVGAVLFLASRGVLPSAGLGLLLAACVVGFLDGLKGWSERTR